MKIVVKKVPKFLRGFVKLIFGIKDWYIRKRKKHVLCVGARLDEPNKTKIYKKFRKNTTKKLLSNHKKFFISYHKKTKLFSLFQRVNT